MHPSSTQSKARNTDTRTGLTKGSEPSHWAQNTDDAHERCRNIHLIICVYLIYKIIYLSSPCIWLSHAECQLSALKCQTRIINFKENVFQNTRVRIPIVYVSIVTSSSNRIPSKKQKACSTCNWNSHTRFLFETAMAPWCAEVIYTHFHCIKQKIKRRARSSRGLIRLILFLLLCQRHPEVNLAFSPQTASVWPRNTVTPACSALVSSFQGTGSFTH